MDWLLSFTICLYLVKLGQCTYTKDGDDTGSFSVEEIFKDSIISTGPWIAKEMFLTNNQSFKNTAISGISLLGTLLQMNSVASLQVKYAIQQWLGVSIYSSSYSPSSLCGEFKKFLSFASCYGRDEYSILSFYKNVFHDHSLEPSESQVGNGCFQNYFSAIDFKNQSKTIEEINNWYSNLIPYSESVYLTELLRKETRFFFVNLLKFKTLSNLGYKAGTEKVKFYNMNNRFLELDSMSKVGDYYYKLDNKVGGTVLREDLPGEKHSLVFIIADNKSQESITRFKNLFNLDTFSYLFKLALGLTEKTKLKLTLPQICINTTMDLRRPLENMCMTSLFTQDRALEKLFGSKSRVHEMPHVASFHIIADEEKQKETDYTEEVELNTPFWVILADREIPLISALFLGEDNFS